MYECAGDFQCVYLQSIASAHRESAGSHSNNIFTFVRTRISLDGLKCSLFSDLEANYT